MNNHCCCTHCRRRESENFFGAIVSDKIKEDELERLLANNNNLREMNKELRNEIQIADREITDLRYIIEEMNRKYLDYKNKLREKEISPPK